MYYLQSSSFKGDKYSVETAKHMIQLSLLGGWMVNKLINHPNLKC